MKLKDLIRHAEFKILTLVSGKSGLDRGVKWTASVELITHAEFINEHDLVFITGFVVNNEISLLQMIYSIYQQKASGVVIATGPYIQKIPDSVIKFGNDNDFPIFSMPWDVKISTVTHALAEHILFDKIPYEEEINAVLKEYLLRKEDDDLSNNARNMLNDNALLSFKSARVILFAINSHPVMPVKEALPNDSLVKETIIYKLNDHINRLYYLTTLPVRLDDRIVYIITNESWNQYNENALLKDVLALLANLNYSQSDYRVTAGIGNFCSGIENIGSSYREASYAAKIYSKKPLDDILALRYSNVKYYKLICENNNRNSLKEYYSETLAALENYDKTHNSGLIGFLEDFFTCNCNINETGQKLFLHRNTVIYKLKKIESILKIDISCMEDLMAVWLAIAIKNVNDPAFFD